MHFDYTVFATPVRLSPGAQKRMGLHCVCVFISALNLNFLYQTRNIKKNIVFFPPNASVSWENKAFCTKQVGRLWLM